MIDSSSPTGRPATTTAAIFVAPNLMGLGWASRTETGHTGTTRIAIRAGGAWQIAVNPWFQRVLTHWKPGSTASRRATQPAHGQLELTGNTLLMVLLRLASYFAPRATPTPATHD